MAKLKVFFANLICLLMQLVTSLCDFGFLFLNS